MSICLHNEISVSWSLFLYNVHPNKKNSFLVFEVESSTKCSQRPSRKTAQTHHQTLATFKNASFRYCTSKAEDYHVLTQNHNTQIFKASSANLNVQHHTLHPMIATQNKTLRTFENNIITIQLLIISWYTSLEYFSLKDNIAHHV